MYTLYFLPDACPLATQVVLHELNQPVDIIDKREVEDFLSINPVGDVPVLVENASTEQSSSVKDDANKRVIRREGAAVLLYLLDKHPNNMMPSSGPARELAIQNIMFANATMHPTYGRLFFIAGNLNDESAKKTAFNAATNAINHLWGVVEQQLTDQPYLGGKQPSAADIMLSVYSRWGASFPVDIQIGPNAQAMVDSVLAMPSFQRALHNEHLKAAA